METIFLTFMNILIILFLIVLIAIFACIFVFIDSRKRDMNTKFWVFLSSIFNLFALIAYFIVRKIKTDKLNAEPKKQKHKKSDVAVLLVAVFVCIISPVLYFPVLSALRSIEMKDYEVTATTVSMETVETMSPEIAQWIEECNNDKDNDVFVLYSYNSNSVGEIVYIKGYLGAEEMLEYKITPADSLACDINIELPSEKADPTASNITYFKTIDVWQAQYFDEDYCYRVSAGDDEKEVVYCETYACIDAPVEKS